MIYNNRPTRPGGMFMRNGPNPYMRPGNVRPMFRRPVVGTVPAQNSGPMLPPNLGPFDLLRFRSTFESYNEEAGLNEALSRRLADLTPSEDEKRVLDSFVTRVLAGVQTLIDDPEKYPDLDLDEVKVVGSYKKETMLTGDRKMRLLLKTRSLAKREKLAELVRLLPQVCHTEPKKARKFMCVQRPYGVILKETDNKTAKRTETALNQSAAAGLDGFIPDTDDGFGDYVPNPFKPVEPGVKQTVKLNDPNALWMEICIAVIPKKKTTVKKEDEEKTKEGDEEENADEKEDEKEDAMEADEAVTKKPDADGDTKEEEAEEKPDEEDPTTKPLSEVLRWRQRKGFSDLRQCVWFEEKVTDPTVKKLIILLTDLARRFPAFRYLIKNSTWPIELLAHYCVCPSQGGKRNAAFNKHPNLELGPALRRCLQKISCGLFLPGGFNIQDPTHFSPYSMSHRLYLRMSLKQLDELSTMSHLLMRLIIGYGLFDIVFCNTDYNKPGELENLLAVASARTGILITHGEEVITEADMAARHAERAAEGEAGADTKGPTKRRPRQSMGEDDDDDSVIDELNCSSESILE